MAFVTHSCINCSNAFAGNYCNVCGEKVHAAEEKKITHLFGEGFHFITHFEGKFLYTLKAILLSPGKLSDDYCKGIQKKYYKPISFFLLLIILYLVFPVFKGLNVELASHGDYATAKVNELMLLKGWTPEYTAEKFHLKSEKVSKFLLLVIIPVFALFNFAFFFRRKRVFYDHFIFITEVASLFLFWGFLLLPVLTLLLAQIFVRVAPTFTQNYLFNGELFTGSLLLLPFLVYVALASKRFYKLSGWLSFLYAVLFVAVFSLFLLTIYRMVLFHLSIQLLF